MRAPYADALQNPTRISRLKAPKPRKPALGLEQSVYGFKSWVQADLESFGLRVSGREFRVHPKASWSCGAAERVLLASETGLRWGNLQEAQASSNW